MSENSTSLSGHTDPADEAPWAMQLVVQIDKSTPPHRTPALAAAGTAVAALLHDDRVTDPTGDWHAPVHRWLDGRIRKHCRRAKPGATWDRAAQHPGTTATIDGATVRAFVPTSVEAIPKDIGRLQMAGTELADPNPITEVDPAPAGPIVVSLSPSPPLTFGKAAAAAGHAAQIAAMRMTPERLAAWRACGFPVQVEHPTPARWDALRATAPVEIVDAGFTEVEPGTTTALARWA